MFLKKGYSSQSIRLDGEGQFPIPVFPVISSWTITISHNFLLGRYQVSSGLYYLYPRSKFCSEFPKGQKSNNERTGHENLPIVSIKLTDNTGYRITGFTSLVLLTILCCLVLIKYRDTPLVKASNRELSVILLTSIALFFV